MVIISGSSHIQELYDCDNNEANESSTTTNTFTNTASDITVNTVSSQPQLASSTSLQLAVAVLTCRKNSHSFEERRIILESSIKIGRAVARVRPAGDNAIFDCKVLSRNHALLWYDEGKVIEFIHTVYRFYLLMICIYYF
jgi:hypothetical protein